MEALARAIHLISLLVSSVVFEMDYQLVSSVVCKSTTSLVPSVVYVSLKLREVDMILHQTVSTKSKGQEVSHLKNKIRL